MEPAFLPGGNVRCQHAEIHTAGALFPRAAAFCPRGRGCDSSREAVTFPEGIPLFNIPFSLQSDRYTCNQ